MVNAEVQILKGIGDETNIELWPESVELCDPSQQAILGWT
jgi:hypothetical protein